MDSSVCKRLNNRAYHKTIDRFQLEVCSAWELEFPFPWDFHENGSSFGLLMEMGMGIVTRGMGIAYFIGKK